MAKNVGEVDMYFVDNEIKQETQAIHDHTTVQSPMAVDN
jgi:hypothetical protein